ncbi:stage VI sporulation protein D [Metabacillus hrfriensis]|uniref:Stage VI sporulation protein D n=1 Tax=Metabacillus hrfriensis TaxID=3048891 RepID=A0ACD4R8A5_9BACI|nr:stage VI sporulation protein D [Metabacillus sp. CT-WN-B3]WHZ56707.1 stage VI sporulation protein D [Metabacillus sp. CT-WN-B3]
MSQDQQSSLRFSVEESVWFQKGQEVGELLSISLDPDITIQEFDQYISIRGALQLTGEYKIDEDYNEEEFEYANLRFVNSVETREEDGISQLVHRFPVDITIPRNRIGDLEEVYVTIESFDYDLSESRNLKLVADLEISGISSQDSFEEVQEEKEEEQTYNHSTKEELEPLYRSSQALLHEEETQEAYSESFDAVLAENSDTPEKEEFYQPFDVGVRKQAIEEEVTQSFDVEVRKQAIEEEVTQSFDVEVRKQAIEEEITQPEIHYSAGRPAEAEVESYSAPPKQSPKSRKEEAKKQEQPKETENSLYLTKLFGREDEEEFSKLKICIVQQGDTIDSICDRYNITVQQLHRVNQFSSTADVHEGQTLYIPVYANTH